MTSVQYPPTIVTSPHTPAEEWAQRTTSVVNNVGDEDHPKKEPNTAPLSREELVSETGQIPGGYPGIIGELAFIVILSFIFKPNGLRRLRCGAFEREYKRSLVDSPTSGARCVSKGRGDCQRVYSGCSTDCQRENTDDIR